MVESPPPLVEQVPRHEDPPNLWVTLSAIAVLVHVVLLGVAIPLAVRVTQAQVEATAPIPVEWVDGDPAIGVEDAPTGMPEAAEGSPTNPDAAAYNPQSGLESSPPETNPGASEPTSEDGTGDSGTGSPSTHGSGVPEEDGSGATSGDDGTAGTGDDSGAASPGEEGTATSDPGQTQGSASGVVARFGVRSHPNGRDLPDQLPVLQQPVGTVQLLPESNCMPQDSPLGEGLPMVTVTLQVLIEADGRLSQATVWQSSGNPTLDALAECWVTTDPPLFQPALAGGSPIATDAVLLDVMLGGG